MDPGAVRLVGRPLAVRRLRRLHRSVHDHLRAPLGPEDFRRLAYEFCQDEARTGVAYAEVVFSPSNHAPRLGDDWFGPIEAVLDGLEAGRRDFG